MDTKGGGGVVAVPKRVFEKGSVQRITHATDRPTDHVPEREAVAGVSSHTRPTSAGNFEFVFPLQLSLTYFVVEFGIPDLKFLRRLCTI
jgi:hypothetical protein